MSGKEVAEDIIAVLKKHLTGDFKYINPNFLVDIKDACEAYYQVSDDEVDKLTIEMFGA